MNNQDTRFANQYAIQWFPGHMAKTLRMMEQEILHVDASLVLLDARIPLSSLNPEIEHAAEGVGAATEQLVKRRSAADDQLRRLMQVRQAVVQGVEIAAVPRGKVKTLRERARSEEHTSELQSR